MRGQQVLLFNLRLKLFCGKLKSRWLDPFKILKFYPYRDVDLLNETKGEEFKVNVQRVTPYFDDP